MHASSATLSELINTPLDNTEPAYLLNFEFEQVQPQIAYGHITIPAQTISTIYDETARTQQRSVRAAGFAPGKVPIAYIQEHFQANLLGHMKEFLFKYNVLNCLYRAIRTHKIPIAGEPRLFNIDLRPQHSARYTFEFSLLPAIEIQEWKYLPFKAPKRKNYKDLDRQVESFITCEQDALKAYQDNGIEVGDWVYFSLALADQNNVALIPEYSEQFWFKLGNEDTDNPLRSLFLNKKIGDIFCSSDIGLQTYFSNQLDTTYNFQITIVDILPAAYFCLELFKRHFKLKTNKDVSKKLIEVFSYRNDMSQRRSMVDETLKLLMYKNRFDIPNHLVLREQKRILDTIQKSPDYNVYRTQKDFNHRVKQLAEKLARESSFIDSLAYHENITVNKQDVKGYLNFTLRPRMREFLYFKHPEPTIEGQEIPIAAEELNRTALREKTINYAIYHLTKR